jgi:hypothetical protein
MHTDPVHHDLRLHNLVSNNIGRVLSSKEGLFYIHASTTSLKARTDMMPHSLLAASVLCETVRPAFHMDRVSSHEP